MSPIRAVVLAAMLFLAPLGARGADLVVWWDEGVYLEQDAALAELISAFEQETGKDVKLVQYPFWEMEGKAKVAIDAGHPPDFLFSVGVETFGPWAYEDRLVDLTETFGSQIDLFDADLLELSTLLNGRTGRRGVYALPMGRVTHHLHVWKNLLERAD